VLVVAASDQARTRQQLCSSPVTLKRRLHHPPATNILLEDLTPLLALQVLDLEVRGRQLAHLGGAEVDAAPTAATTYRDGEITTDRSSPSLPGHSILSICVTLVSGFRRPEPPSNASDDLAGTIMH
jgi:hypothetical protein